MDVVVDEGDVGGIGDEDAFVVGVVDFKAGDDDVGYSGKWRGGHAVDEDAVRLAGGVDDGWLGIGRGGDEGERLGDGDLLGVGAVGDLNGVSGCGGSDGGGDGGFASEFASGVDAEGGGGGYGGGCEQETGEGDVGAQRLCHRF